MDRRVGLFARWLINGIAIWAAISWVDGIDPVNTGFMNIALIALVFGFVNALIRPIIMFFTFPFILITLGLGTLLINTLMFWLAGEIGRMFDIGFTVDGFWPAFWGALVVSLVSWVLSGIFGEKKSEKRDND